jgi:hypothetical protein
MHYGEAERNTWHKIQNFPFIFYQEVLCGRRFKINSVFKRAILIYKFIRFQRLNHRQFLASSLLNVGSKYIKRVPQKCTHTVPPPFSLSALLFDKMALEFLRVASSLCFPSSNLL